MKGLEKKSFKKFGFIGLLGVSFAILAYMYLSHDVTLLKEQYPQIKRNKDDEISFSVDPGKPKNWVPLRSISPFAKWAIVLSEDWSFYQHEGVDLEQMKVAFSEMLKGSRFRGASTITQQMVKNVYLSDSRTLWRKLHELILAHKVEQELTKERILEIYFNCIEYGPGLYGIKQASHHYFGKSASELGPREGAFLAMLLPSPKRYYVSFRKKKLTKFARKRIDAILIKMRMGKVITRESQEEARQSKFSWEK